MTEQERIKHFRLTIGSNIRYYREGYIMTVNELAEYANIDEKNLSRIEKGQVTPRTDTLAKLAEVLKVNPDDLFSGTKGMLEIIPEKDRIRNKRRRRKKR